LLARRPYNVASLIIPLVAGANFTTFEPVSGMDPTMKLSGKISAITTAVGLEISRRKTG
jgi:hypothetical protein